MLRKGADGQRTNPADAANMQESMGFVRGVLGRYDETLVLSCTIQHIKCRKTVQKRVLVVTTGALYIVNVHDKGNPKRRVPLNAVRSILTPVSYANELFVCMNHEYDCHIRTPHRAQIVMAIQMHQHSLNVVDLPMDVIEPMLQDKNTWKKAKRAAEMLASTSASRGSEKRTITSKTFATASSSESGSMGSEESSGSRGSLEGYWHGAEGERGTRSNGKASSSSGRGTVRKRLSWIRW